MFMSVPRVSLLSLFLASALVAAPVLGATALLPLATEAPAPALDPVVSVPTPERPLAEPRAAPAELPAPKGDAIAALPVVVSSGATVAETAPQVTPATERVVVGEGIPDDISGPAPQQESSAAPQNWNNTTGNITHGSASWDPTNKTLTVVEGNFSHNGINCTWGAFTWTVGEDLLSLLNITCDFWGLFTVNLFNGTVTVTWSNGSWNHTFDAPPAPELWESGWNDALSQVAATAQTPRASAGPAPILTLKL